MAVAKTLFSCKILTSLRSEQFKLNPNLIFTMTLENGQSMLTYHSVRRLLTGFMRAAFRAWKLTVHNVMKSMPAPARTKIQGER